MSDVAEKLAAVISRSPSSALPSHAEKHDSGISSPKTAMRGHTHILATPTTPSATPSLPTASDISTTSSSYQGVSSLWLQLLVSRFALHLYGREDADTAARSSRQKYHEKGSTISMTSARSEALKESSVTGRRPYLSSSASSPSLKVTVEVESLSLQVDVQERCTDFILKLASMESDLCVLSECSDGSNSWEPYLIHSKGKLFSSAISNLPDDILQVTAPVISANQFQSSGQGIGIDSNSCLSPKLHSSFAYVTGYFPTRFPRVPKLEVNIRPFELVVWLPVIKLAISIVSSGIESHKTQPTIVRALSKFI